MFHLRFGLSDHLKALLDFVFGSRRRVKKVRIFRAWFSHIGVVPCVFGLSTFPSSSGSVFAEGSIEQLMHVPHKGPTDTQKRPAA